MFKGLYLVAIATVLAACGGASAEEMRGQYLSACAKSSSHLAGLTDGRVSSDEFCPCMYDRVIAGVDPQYSDFAVNLLLISAGQYPLSHAGFNGYMANMKTLLASRQDGNAAYHHSLAVMTKASPVCLKKS